MFNTIKDKFLFGKYKGKSLIEVYKEDKGYVEWCMSNIDGFTLAKGILEQLKNGKPDEIDLPGNFNTDGFLFSLVEKIIDAKFKFEILNKVLQFIESEKPDMKDFGNDLASMLKFIYEVNNPWNHKRGLAEKMKNESSDELKNLKTMLISFCLKNFNILNNIWEYKVNCASEEMSDVVITIIQNETPGNSDFLCKIKTSGDHWFDFSI